MPAHEGNKYAEGNPGGGRPSEYKPEYADMAYKISLLGATDAELATIFDVSEQTINNWKLQFEEFSLALKKGKTLADANVADRLYQRAMGYTHDAVKIFPSGGESEDKEGNKVKGPLIVPYQEHYPPDTVAAIFWLKNRQKDKWRDKQEIDHRTPDGLTINYKNQPGNEPLTDAGN